MRPGWRQTGEVAFAHEQGARVVALSSGQKPWCAFTDGGKELCGSGLGRALRFTTAERAMRAVDERMRAARARKS